jgi:hypothetical protein
VAEENGSSNPNQPDSQMSLHERVSVLCWLSRFFLILIVIVVCINWLGDFLHAPLGIKDNPPEPGPLVQFAQVAIFPALICYFVLRVMKYFSGEYSSRDFLLGSAGVLLFISVVLLLVGPVLHRELIPGTFYFWRTLAAPLSGAAFLTFDGSLAYGLIRNWRSLDNVRYKWSAALFVLSTLFGVVALIGFCVPSEKKFLICGAWAVLLFILGVLLTPLTKESKPTPSAP